MKTIRTKVYQFSELSDDAKEVVVNRFYGINVNYDWWEFVYEDAANIGLKITAFDLDRASYCKGEFVNNGVAAAKAILKEHGESCETYKTAKNFIEEVILLDEKAKNENKDGNEDYWFSDEMDELEEDFLKSLCEDYKIILSKEYDHLTSEATIIETIEANEYNFTKDGQKFNY